MKKGIVLEVHSDYITMLTPDGEFLKGKKTNDTYAIGEETTFYPYLPMERERKTIFAIPKISWKFVSVLASLLLILSFLPRLTQSEVHAYVGLDVNPSIELGVNKKLQVVELEAYNEEGQLIIDQLDDWHKKHMHNVTTELIHLMQKQGYMDTERQIVITSVLTNLDDITIKAKIEKEVQDLTLDIQKEEIVVTVIETSVENRELAREQGMSAGKYVQSEQTNIVEVTETEMEASDLDEQETDEESKVPVTPAKGESKKDEKLKEVQNKHEQIREKQDTKREEQQQRKAEQEKKKQERQENKQNNKGNNGNNGNNGNSGNNKNKDNNNGNKGNNGKPGNSGNNGKAGNNGNNGNNGNGNNPRN